MHSAGVRRIVSWIVSAAAATLMLMAYGAAQTNPEDKMNERGAPLFSDLGDHEFAISTKSPQALETRYAQQAVADARCFTMDAAWPMQPNWTLTRLSRS